MSGSTTAWISESDISFELSQKNKYYDEVVNCEQMNNSNNSASYLASSPPDGSSLI